MTNPTLGLIGVGLMGHGIASNLVKHGHPLVVLEHPGNQPLDALLMAGARTAATPAGAPHDLEVVPRSRHVQIDLPQDAGIQDVFRHLANDQARTEAIAAEVRDAFAQGRKVLVLTERTEHLDAIEAALGGLGSALFVLHGRMSRKRRAALMASPITARAR